MFEWSIWQSRKSQKVKRCENQNILHGNIQLESQRSSDLGR